jgi:excisionase family DNA binding protein
MASAVARLLLTVGQASTLTGLSEAFWRKKIWLREIETVRLGRAVRIPTSVVEAMIADGTIPAREQPQQNQ